MMCVYGYHIPNMYILIRYSYGMVWYGMAWHDMAWYGMAWHGMVWYGMIWYGMVWHSMAWHGMVWYCQPDDLVLLCQNLRVYLLRKKSVSKEMNSDTYEICIAGLN